MRSIMHKEQKKIHYILIYPMYKVSGMINPNLKRNNFNLFFLEVGKKIY